MASIFQSSARILYKRCGSRIKGLQQPLSSIFTRLFLSIETTMVKASSYSACEHEWERIALQKRNDRENALAKFADWRIKVLEPTSDVSQLPLQKLTDRERNIVKCDATALADLIRKRIYTSVEVVLAFAKAAVVAQDVTNCLTEIFIEEALDRAQELDKHLEVSGNVIGPLHGQPFLIFLFMFMCLCLVLCTCRCTGFYQRPYQNQGTGHVHWIHWFVLSNTSNILLIKLAVPQVGPIRNTLTKTQL